MLSVEPSKMGVNEPRAPVLPVLSFAALTGGRGSRRARRRRRRADCFARALLFLALVVAASAFVRTATESSDHFVAGLQRCTTGWRDCGLRCGDESNLHRHALQFLAVLHRHRGVLARCDRAAGARAAAPRIRRAGAIALAPACGAACTAVSGTTSAFCALATLIVALAVMPGSNLPLRCSRRPRRRR